MNNPDEKTAVEQFGSQGKYFGACMLLATMPGLPMFGHGQIEGLHEKYGMEYKRAYWDEPVDQGLVRGHEMWIFPLLRRRWLFSGSANFMLYDFKAGSEVDENVFAYSNCVGEHRALVLYHNRYDTTAGWIKESVSYAIKDSSGDTEFRQTSLPDALGVAAGPNLYYAFRDATSGLEYLRHGPELTEKGLYAELGEYQFFVFMDFLEIHDDKECSWGALCTVLGGRGVASIDIERRQVRYASLNAAFRQVLEEINLITTSALADLVAAEQKLIHAIQRFLSIHSAQTGGTAARTTDILSQISQILSFLASLPTIRPKAHEAKHWQAAMYLLLNTPRNLRMLLAWLMLRDADPESFDTFGLDHSMYGMLSAEEQPQQSGAAIETVQLLRALLACDDSRRRPCAFVLESAFSIPACVDYLMVHESEGVVWFNKERFELFVQWLLVADLLARATDRPTSRTIAARFGAAGREMRRLVELAAHAGYRGRCSSNWWCPSRRAVLL